MIGLGGLLLPSDGLQGVAERHMQFGGLRRLGEQPAIHRDRRLVFSEADARGRVERKIIPVAGFEPQQGVDLFTCLQIFLPVNKYTNVVQTCSAVIRCELQSRFE